MVEPPALEVAKRRLPRALRGLLTAATAADALLGSPRGALAAVANRDGRLKAQGASARL